MSIISLRKIIDANLRLLFVHHHFTVISLGALAPKISRRVSSSTSVIFPLNNTACESVADTL